MSLDVSRAVPAMMRPLIIATRRLQDASGRRVEAVDSALASKLMGESIAMVRAMDA